MNAAEIEKCINDFGTDIYRFCLKLCSDKTDAEDLYQQTFATVYKGIHIKKQNNGLPTY